MDLEGNLTFVATFHSCISDSLECFSLRWVIISDDGDLFCCFSYQIRAYIHVLNRNPFSIMHKSLLR